MSYASEAQFSKSQALARLVPLGHDMLLVRFSDTLSDIANRRAIAFAADLAREPIAGVREIVPGLVSVALAHGAGAEREAIEGEVRLRMERLHLAVLPETVHDIDIVYDGPDLPEVAEQLSLTPQDFIERHQSSKLRVLATGFAPGFIYCGFHGEDLAVDRRLKVRSSVAPGTVLFAVRQTAITATDTPTGWSVIGHTSLRNFDVDAEPAVQIRAGELLRFVRS